MRKFAKAVVNAVKKASNKGVVTSLALMLVAASQITTQACTVWILGQDDMPEELL